MIQDIFPHVFRNEYTPRQPVSGDIFFSFDGNDILLKEDGTVFSYADLPEVSDAVYLFELDGKACFLKDLSLLPNSRQQVRMMRSYRPKHLGFAAVTAWQLYLWYRDSAFCGRCGTRCVHSETERAMVCPSCGNTVYPKIMPAVIVGVLSRDGRILVTRFAHSTYRHYALISGFAETGETIEETVRREVKEECGIDVTNIRYYGCQPWSFSSTLLFGFYCDALSEDITLDENELSTAKWAARGEDTDSMDDASLTSQMLRNFHEGKAVYGS